MGSPSRGTDGRFLHRLLVQSSSTCDQSSVLAPKSALLVLLLLFQQTTKSSSNNNFQFKVEHDALWSTPRQAVSFDKVEYGAFLSRSRSPLSLLCLFLLALGGPSFVLPHSFLIIKPCQVASSFVLVAVSQHASGCSLRSTSNSFRLRYTSLLFVFALLYSNVFFSPSPGLR